MRAWFEFDWQPWNFGAYILKAIGRTLSELVLLSCVVFVLRHFVELFRNSTAERERCCSTSDISPSVSCRRERCCLSFDIFSSRVASSWTLVFNADHQLDDHRESRETSTEAAGSYVSSDRVIPVHLISIAERGHAVRTVHRVTSHRFSSKSVSIHAGRSLVVVNIRLTARLQSLPLARC